MYKYLTFLWLQYFTINIDLGLPKCEVTMQYLLDPTNICITLSVPIITYWIYWRWRNRRMLELAKLLPGPPALPVLGNALSFMISPNDQLNMIAALLNKHGDYTKFWLGPDLNVIVKNASDIRLLLTSNKVNQKGPNYKYMIPFIGRGILSGGPKWRIYRKIAMPSYNKKAIQIYSKLFNREADDLVQIFSRKDPKQTFDIFPDVLNCTTQSVCQTLMGLSKEDSQSINCLKEVVTKTKDMYNLIFSKMVKWWLQIPFIYWITGNKKTERYYQKIVEKMTSHIVEKRREALTRETVDEDSMGIVDRLILSGLSEKEIKCEVFALFTTSQEASAKIASGVLLLLAHLPEWQEKVYREILEIIDPQDDFFTEEQLKKLHNLEMVYKETLRYLSIASMIQRTVEEEIAINNGQITIPAGTSLVIPIHELHRDTRYWDEPYKIKPERFLPENVQNRDQNAFVPFSLGPMDCLGRVYATHLIKTIVVKVIRQLQLEADGRIEDLKLHVAISVRFADGYNLRVRKRRMAKENFLQHG